MYLWINELQTSNFKLKANHNQEILQFHFKKFILTASRDQLRPILARNHLSRIAH